MSPEIIAAIIAAIVGTVSAIITLSIGIGQLRNDRKRLDSEVTIERKKLEYDRERLQTELKENAEQTRVWKAEVEKLKAETQKLSIEADDMRRRRLEAERLEIRNLLILFDRAVFDGPNMGGDAVEMYNALHETRKSMQTSGASLVRDREIAEHFQKIREILLTMEAEVKRRFPMVVQLATEINNPLSEKRQRVPELLGRQDLESVIMMIQIRNDVNSHIQAIRQRLRMLDESIDS